MKKLIHILRIGVVAAVMCLLLVAPASALAFGQLPSEIEVPLYARWTFPTLDGTHVSESTYADKTHILIFINSKETAQGEYACTNSGNTVKGIAASDWIADDRLQVTVIDAMGNDRDSMAAMKEKLAPNDTEINF